MYDIIRVAGKQVLVSPNLLEAFFDGGVAVGVALDQPGVNFMKPFRPKFADNFTQLHKWLKNNLTSKIIVIIPRQSNKCCFVWNFV
jgi:hypothetical protein